MTSQDPNHTKAGDPGLSLWLVPPTDSAIYKALSNAIVNIVPPILNASESPPRFEPHVTLASRIPKQITTSNPQKWLDELDLPTISAAEVRFQELAVGDTFTKKLFIRCERAESLLQLAASCRVQSSANVDEADYDPHVSLV
jgi:2'-5' RNA ligase